MKKRGQIELSFGMIFSIILIIVFLVFAFYAIKTFLGFSDKAKAGKFFTDVQSDIDRIWRNSAFSSEQREYIVQSNADFVCIIDFSSDARGENSLFYTELRRTNYGSENLAFYPVKLLGTGFESEELKHIDISKITSEENPLCIKTRSGKVTFILKKDFGEALVIINKP
jgi:hypothetical protein